jgi:hypothetical protein
MQPYFILLAILATLLVPVDSIRAIKQSSKSLWPDKPVILNRRDGETPAELAALVAQAATDEAARLASEAVTLAAQVAAASAQAVCISSS